MSLEAVAGKNPVTHVGKLYNVLAQRVAAALTTDIAGVVEAECLLVSQIGQPITQPKFADLRLRLAEPAALAVLRPGIEALLHAHLERLPQWWREALVRSDALW